jgi:hypothetical protein
MQISYLLRGPFQFLYSLEIDLKVNLPYAQFCLCGALIIVSFGEWEKNPRLFPRSGIFASLRLVKTLV